MKILMTLLLLLVLCLSSVSAYCEDDELELYLKNKKHSKATASKLSIADRWYWKSGNQGNYYEIEFSGTSSEIKGVCMNLSRHLIEHYGHVNDIVCFEGRLSGNMLTGKKLTRYPIKMKNNCPDKLVEWSEFEATLSNDGNRLAGRWFQNTMNDRTCVVTPNKWIDVEFYRVVPVETPKPVKQKRTVDKFVVY